MAFLPALAAAAPAAAGTAAAGTAAAAAAGTAGAALTSGITAGTLLGTGAATSGVLGGLGLNALGGMTSLLPASAATSGLAGLAAATPAALSAAAPATAGIFSQAAPALGGLQSLAPAASGFKSLAMANAPLAAGANPATFSAMNQALGMGNLGAQTANIAPTLTQTAAIDTSKGLIGNQLVPKAAASVSKTPMLDVASPEYAARAREIFQPSISSSGAPLYQSAGYGVPELAKAPSAVTAGENFMSNLGNLIQNPSMQGVKDYAKEHPYATAAGVYGLYKAMQPDYKPPKQDVGMIRPYKFERTPRPEAYAVSPTADSSERLYFTDTFTPLEPYPADSEETKKAAAGGIMGLAVGGPVEQRAAMDSVGNNMMYPQSQYQTPVYSNPMVQNPVPSNVIRQGDEGPSMFTDAPKFAEGGEPKTEGGYKYSYDPKTQVFTQLSVPKIVPEATQSGYLGGVMGRTPQQYVRYTGEGVPPGDDYQYVPGGMGGPAHYLVPPASQTPANTGAKVSGGIAAPVGGLPPLTLAPSQTQGPLAGPPAPVTTQPPINVPAYQSPEERLGLTDFYAMMNRRLAQQGGYAAGGSISDLGGYSDGGRLLKGPGDGVSDSIPAVIGQRQPARLADGEFVIPARIVSELGNGSTEAGARKLYAMMDRVQKARKKSVGKNKVAANTKADKYLPA